MARPRYGSAALWPSEHPVSERPRASSRGFVVLPEPRPTSARPYGPSTLVDSDALPSDVLFINHGTRLMDTATLSDHKDGRLPASSHGVKIDSFAQAAELERELRANIKGEVRFDPGSRGAYSMDASNYRQIPIGLVVPSDEADVVAAVAICRKFGAPILSRGGGTSLAGQGCNAAVVLDFSKYLNRILELNPEQRFARYSQAWF